MNFYKILVLVTKEKNLIFYIEAKTLLDAYHEMSRQYIGGWEEILSIEKVDGMLINNFKD